MSLQCVSLVDCGTGQTIDAVVKADLPLLRAVDVEEAWSPYRFAAIRQFLNSGGAGAIPEHVHWNWAVKVLQFNSAVHCLVGIEAAGEIQGLMWIWLSGRSAWLPPAAGETLVYVDYLETAPWNTLAHPQPPRFKGVGTGLLQAAIYRSQQEGFDGRIGLHTLPQSEGFYANRCGMQNLGTDSAYQNLTYFEFTAAAAAHFLTR